MYFCRKRSCLFILVLAQILIVLAETNTDECAVQTTADENLTEKDITEEYKTDEITKSPVPIGVKEGDVKESTEPMLNFIAANTSSSLNTTKVNCLTDLLYEPVEIVNATRLTQLLVSEAGPTNRSKNEKEDRQIPARCILVLFYAPWCVFSSQAAPHFNALPHACRQIKAVAIDAIEHQSFIAQYGVVGVPTLMLVHNGKPVAKFNDTVYTLESFTKFIMRYTNLQPNGLLYVTLLDFLGPLSNVPSNDTDYYLVLSWVFITICALYFTSKSRWWQQFVELVQNTWRESNAQHEHVE